MTDAGREDLDRAAHALAARVPWPLAPLARLAYNYRWSWLPDGPQLFRGVDPSRWRMCGANPVRLLQEASNDALIRAAANRDLVSRAEAAEVAVRADMARPSRSGQATDEHPAAFFCAEFAVHQSLPIYSGGLGALAGDILKEASDLAVPMIGVGLMYRRGYFRQRIDASGWQQEYWVPTDPERTPAALVSDDDGRPLRVTVPVAEQEVHVRVWRVDVGRVPLFLLDSDVPENDRLERWITSRLYDGDPETRLAQYALLGMGGVAALEAMEIEPSVIHMNEGHAAFAALAAARSELRRGASSFDDAVDRVRARTVFTTHTPVPAGNDTYPPGQIAHTLQRVAADLGVDAGAFVRLGRTNPDDEHEPFGVTQFALRTSRRANGVSRRHGGVSREMWQGLWPERSVDDVPITHVTNGVHLPSWVGAPMRRLLDAHLGSDWAERAAEGEPLDAIDAIPAADLWAVRNEQRRLLVEFVRDRSLLDRVGRGEARHYAAAAARAFDPEVLTIGFARRLATYKRLNLILHDAERALGVLGGERRVQLVLAGKAHPRDDGGKSLVQGLFGFRGNTAASEHVVFLEDYDLGTASRLVRGCDVWVNLPRPPLEASGTSGMKSVVNGGLQLSVLDGWWAEAYDGGNGWALSGDVDHDHGAQDHRDASELYRLLEEEVVPEFYERSGDGIPEAWVARIRKSMRTLIPQFSSGRMVRDYADRIYAAEARV